MAGNKKYGLILPDKGKAQQPTFQASRNVFGDDSDSDNEVGKKPVLLRPSDNINRQAKSCQEKAIAEDPTVYQYDEIYDSMTIKKDEKKNKSKEEKKPRYIDNLLKAAGKRKVENERRLERQIQKEREKEGDEFADKEVFVTSAYKKKLEEMRLEEEKEKREEFLESIGDVTKQSDLGGFYRHLYEQKLGKDQGKKTEDLESNNQQDPKDTEDGVKTPKIEKSKKRNYRKRKSSADLKQHLSEGEIDDSDDEINRMKLSDIKHAKKSKIDENIDADSDFSIDESSDEEKTKDNKSDRNSGGDTPKLEAPADVKVSENNQNIKEAKHVKTTPQEQKLIEEEPKPKVDIWKKRTVGEVFDQALRRYYERKSARGA